MCEGDSYCKDREFHLSKWRFEEIVNKIYYVMCIQSVNKNIG